MTGPAHTEPSDTSRPTFLIGGVMKGGTSSLHWYLGQHPEVFVTTRKELHFFDRPPARRAATLDRYLANFDGTGKFRAQGESTPSYCYAPGAVGAIAEFDPTMRLIIALRDPVDRAISHIAHRKRIARRPSKSITHGPIWEELALDLRSHPRQIGAEISSRSRGYHTRGHYHEQLRRIYEHFPQDQVLVLCLEDSKVGAQAEPSRVTGFPGVSRHGLTDPTRSNGNAYERPDQQVCEYPASYCPIRNRILTEDCRTRTDDRRLPSSCRP